jgi:small subunit ribosomal protein S9
MASVVYSAVGRRKKAISKVILTQGSGEVTVNNKPLLDFFNREVLTKIVEQPLELTGTLSTYDVKAFVKGGGKSGQAFAMRMGIARALKIANENLSCDLRKAGFLTRDPRMKERKKYGLAKARKRYQFSKR